MSNLQEVLLSLLQFVPIFVLFRRENNPASSYPRRHLHCCRIRKASWYPVPPRLMRSSMSSSFPPDFGPIRVDLIFRLCCLLSLRVSFFFLAICWASRGREDQLRSTESRRGRVSLRRSHLRHPAPARHSTCRKKSQAIVDATIQSGSNLLCYT